MRILLLTWLMVLLAASCLTVSCGGDNSLPVAPDINDVRLAAPEMLSVGAKAVSGVPAGISVTWTRVTGAQGYYLYRYTNTTRPPEPGPDDDPPFPIELRVNGGNLILDPGEGPSVTHSDLFAAVVGETYFYRVTAVDTNDPPQEGYPSSEASWTVNGHTVSSLNPTSAYWGDDVTIGGDTFGVYDELSDSITFPGVDEDVTGAVQSWSDTEITVTVPDDTVTGKVSVIIGSTIAQTDEDLVILNPIIDDINPDQGFVEQDLTISGLNYGAEQGESTVFIGANDVSGAVTGWTDTEIVLTVPATIARGSAQVTVDGHYSNRVFFISRPEILSIDPTSAQEGEPVTLSGRHFASPAGDAKLDGTAILDLTSWDGESIVVTISGEPGDHFISLTSNEGVNSNMVDFTIVEPLSVTMNGLADGALYRPDDPPFIEVTAPDDTDRIELVVDDEIMGDPVTEPPYSGLALQLDVMRNGTHTAKLVAYRREIVAESQMMTFQVYSLVGDINGDGVVNEDDRDALTPLIWLEAGDEDYRIWYDTDEDGVVTEADLSAVGYYWNTANSD